MSKEFFEKVFPMNLQLFADGAPEGGAGGKDKPPVDDNGGASEEDIDDDEGEEGGEQKKTFTQEEVKAMLAKEKRQGKNSVLRKLGLKDVNEGLEKLKSEKKPEGTKVEDKQEKADDSEAKRALKEAEQRAVVAERKAIALSFGVAKDNVDDVVLIASTKVTDDEDFESIVEEMSNDKKYAAFFGKTDDKGEGTGSGVGFKKDSKEPAAGSFGKTLAQKKTQTNLKDQTKLFFDN